MSVLAVLGLAAVCGWTAGPASGPGAATVELAVPSSSVVLGEPLIVQARADLGPGETISLDLQGSTTDSFAITGVQELPSAGRRFEIQIIPLDVGQRAFPLYWTLTRAGSTSSLSVVLHLDVQESPEAAKAHGVKDIKGPRKAGSLLWLWLLLAATLLALWYWNTRRKRSLRGLAAAAGPPPDTRSPEVIAESELASLESSHLWEEGRHKEFYTTLTEILRWYLERRFAFPATRETTSEIHHRLRGLDFDRRLLAVFKELFDRADLVKFSKIAAQTRWGAADLEAARRLVRESTPTANAIPGGVRDDAHPGIELASPVKDKQP
jgi:hypothetical protein